MHKRLREKHYLDCVLNKISYFSIDVIEEEEAFQAYAEQRRYAATLARSGLNSGSNRSSRRGAETDRGLKGNISRFVSFFCLI